MDWEILTKDKLFIMDIAMAMGEYNALLKRYAVWEPDKENPTKHTIREVSNDLSYLQRKYHVSKECVFSLMEGDD